MFSWFDLECNSSGFFFSCFKCITVGETEHAEIWCEWSIERKEFHFQEVKCFFVWLYWLVFNLKCVPQSVYCSQQWLPLGFEVSFKESREFIWDWLSLKCVPQPIFSTGPCQCYRECWVWFVISVVVWHASATPRWENLMGGRESD